MAWPNQWRIFRGGEGAVPLLVRYGGVPESPTSSLACGKSSE